MRALRWLAIVALVLIALDFALMKSPYMLLVHRQQIQRGETIKTSRFGEILNPEGGFVCTYWKGRSALKFIYPPSGCPIFDKPTGIWIGE
jgi:hypothetical protein